MAYILEFTSLESRQLCCISPFVALVERSIDSQLVSIKSDKGTKRKVDKANVNGREREKEVEIQPHKFFLFLVVYTRFCGLASLRTDQSLAHSTSKHTCDHEIHYTLRYIFALNRPNDRLAESSCVQWNTSTTKSPVILDKSNKFDSQTSNSDSLASRQRSTNCSVNTTEQDGVTGYC